MTSAASGMPARPITSTVRCLARSWAAVQAGIQRFVDDLRPDELMLTGQIYDHRARLRSFEIAAEAIRALKLGSTI